MKIQDIVFVLVTLFLLYKQRYEWLVTAALVCMLVSIPFFALWIFFTGQRLIIYAFFFLVLACLLFFNKKRYH